MKQDSHVHSELSRFGEPGTLVLLALSSGPMHGYAMMVSIEQDLGFKLGPGTLYGAIAKLVKLGLIRAIESDERAKPYEITGTGREALAEFIRRWEPAIRFGQARLA
jgi:DNA-binding PadR family transcriptional regulator